MADAEIANKNRGRRTLRMRSSLLQLGLNKRGAEMERRQRTAIWAALFCMCGMASGSFVNGQEIFVDGQELLPTIRRKIPERKELNARFVKVLRGAEADTWKAHLPEKSGDAEIKRFTSAMERVSGDVKAIFESEVDLSPVFLASMDVNCDAFEDFAAVQERSERVSGPLLVRLFGASSDIRVKSAFLKANNSSSIKLTVRTLVPGTTKEDPGCWVYYAPAFDDRRSNWVRFSKISSPTEDTISPGLFVMWSERKGEVGPRAPLNLVGVTTDKAFDVDSPGKQK